VEPDYVVPLKPYELSGGHDPQLEKAIELATEALKTYKRKFPTRRRTSPRISSGDIRRGKSEAAGMLAHAGSAGCSC